MACDWLRNPRPSAVPTVEPKLRLTILVIAVKISGKSPEVTVFLGGDGFPNWWKDYCSQVKALVELGICMTLSFLHTLILERKRKSLWFTGRVRLRN